MIAEAFNESLALRNMVADGFKEVEASRLALEQRVSNIEHAHNGNMGQLETTTGQLHQQLTKLQTDHGMQIAKMNTELTSYLAEKTRLAESMLDLNIKFEIQEKQIDEVEALVGKLASAKIAAPQTSELVEFKLEQLQLQITNLAQGRPPKQDSSPRQNKRQVIDDQIASEVDLSAKNKKVRSSKLGSGPKMNVQSDVLSNGSNSPLQFRNQKGNRNDSVASNVSMQSA